MSEDYDSKFYPRTPPLLTLNKNTSHESKKEDKFISASPVKINLSKAGEERRTIEKPYKTSRKWNLYKDFYQDKKYSQIAAEIIKNFSLNDFINEKAEISLKFIKRDSDMKIINVKDLNENNFTRTASYVETVRENPDKHSMKIVSIKKLRFVEIIVKKKVYIILAIVIFFVIAYIIS